MKSSRPRPGTTHKTEAAAQVHPTALISKGARLAEGVSIGPYCTIGPEVSIGPRTRLVSHVVIQGRTVMGADNVVYPFSTIGLEPQDLKYAGEETRVEIGDGNRIRESVTIHRGTAGGGGVTKIGNECLFMATAHVAHDCRVGSGVVMANSSALAGHVAVGDGAVLGGLVGVHQFVRIGRMAFVGAGSMVAQDISPFMMAVGDRARLIGVNTTGLERHGFDREGVRKLKAAYRWLCLSGLGLAEALEKISSELSDSGEVREVVEFIRASQRGVARG